MGGVLKGLTHIEIIQGFRLTTTPRTLLETPSPTRNLTKKKKEGERGRGAEGGWRFHRGKKKLLIMIDVRNHAYYFGLVSPLQGMP